MAKTRVIRIFSFILALTLVFALIPCGAFSEYEYTFSIDPATKQRFGAWIASALMAGQIMVESVAMPVAHMLEYISDPYDMDYTWTDQAYQDFMDKNQIVIDDNHVNIDGRWYDNVWLSHDAAEKFRTNAYDFKTAYNILSNSNGTFAKGAGFYDGVPMFETSYGYESQYYSAGTEVRNHSDPGYFACGNGQGFYFRNTEQSNVSIGYIDSLGNRYGAFSTYTQTNPTLHFAKTKNGSVYMYACDGHTWHGNRQVNNSLFHLQEFDFTWVSQDVDLDPLSPNEGLSILVPHEDMEPFYQNHPEYSPGSPDFHPNININVDSPDYPDIWDTVSDLLDIIETVLKLLPNGQPSAKWEEQPEPVPPVPDPDPIPEPYPDPQPEPYPDPDPQSGTELPYLDWTELFNILKNIFQKLANIDVTSQSIANTIVEFRNLVDSWFSNLGNHIVNVGNEIINSIRNLPESFESHAIDTIKRGLDGLKRIFLPIFVSLKSAIGIWHYVVEWFQAISVPFLFFMQTITTGYPLMTVPIYASIAGIIVIAVYRRFGR